MARRQSADAFGEATRLAPQRYSANGGRVRRFGRAARLDFRLRRCKRRSPRSPDTSLGLWIGDTRFGAVGEPVTDVPDRFLTSPSAPATFRLPPEAVCLSPRLLRLRPFTRGIPSGRRSPRRDRLHPPRPVHFIARLPVGPCAGHGCAAKRFPAPGSIAPTVVAAKYCRRGCFRCRRRLVRRGARSCAAQPFYRQA